MPDRTYRICSSCGAWRPATDLETVLAESGAGDRQASYRCPDCGHVGPIKDFTLITRSVEAEGPGGSKAQQGGNKR